MADQTLSDEQQALAAELALGLLEGQERAKALRLCLADTRFAVEVETWRHRLSPLLDGIPETAPPDTVWQAIDARLGNRQASGAVRSLHLWRGGALVASAIAAALALVLVTRPAAQPAQTTIGISQLASAQGAVHMAISYDPQKGVLRLGRSAMERGARSPELWVIPEDGIPRSLGIVARNGGSLPVDENLRPFLRDGVTLAITLEDAATAPHKAPTSPPILTGKITII